MNIVRGFSIENTCSHSRKCFRYVFRNIPSALSFFLRVNEFPLAETASPLSAQMLITHWRGRITFVQKHMKVRHAAFMRLADDHVSHTGAAFLANTLEHEGYVAGHRRRDLAEAFRVRQLFESAPRRGQTEARAAGRLIHLVRPECEGSEPRPRPDAGFLDRSGMPQPPAMFATLVAVSTAHMHVEIERRPTKGPHYRVRQIRGRLADNLHQPRGRAGGRSVEFPR